VSKKTRKVSCKLLKTYKGAPIKVPWQRKPLLYTNPSDFDDIMHFIKKWKTANRFLEMATGEGLLLSDHVRFFMHELVRMGAGDVPYKEWVPWTKEKEKQRKKEMERIAENAAGAIDEIDGQEPLDEFDEFAKKQFGGARHTVPPRRLGERYIPKLDTGFRVFRLVDENGNCEGDPGKIQEREEQMGNRLLPGERPRLSRKTWAGLYEFMLCLKYDLEYRAEVEKYVKIINIPEKEIARVT